MDDRGRDFMPTNVFEFCYSPRYNMDYQDGQLLLLPLPPHIHRTLKVNLINCKYEIVRKVTTEMLEFEEVRFLAINAAVCFLDLNVRISIYP